MRIIILDNIVKKVTSNAAKSGLGFIESLKIYDYLKITWIFIWMEETFNSWLLYVVDWTCKRLSEYTSKKNIYDLWKPKCSYPTLNKYLFILHRVYTKLVDLF